MATIITCPLSLTPLSLLPFPSPPSVQCPLSSFSPPPPLKPSKPKSNFPPLSASPAQVAPNPAPSLSNQSPLQRLFPFHVKDAPFTDYLHLLRLSVQHSDFELARAVHASILKLEEDNHLGNALISSYLKLGMAADAYSVFTGLESPDVMSYTALVSGLAKLNLEIQAIHFFFKMRDSGIQPTEFSFVAILSACIRLCELNLGFQIHSMAIKMGCSDFSFVSNALMRLYSEGGLLDFVLELFDKMPKRDIVSWNTVITSLVRERKFERALVLFRDMQGMDNLKADYFTISSLLAAAAGGFCWMEGREIHAHALRMGFGHNLSVNNALIGFYRKCGSVEDVVALFEKMPVKDVISWTEMLTAYMESGMVDLAVKVFDEMPEKNCISYNALLAGLCQNREEFKAMNLFLMMVKEGIEVTEHTLTSAVKSCGLLTEARLSEQIHGFTVKLGSGSNSYTEAALLDMCTRCGRMEDAEKMFQHWPFDKDSSIIWSSMLCGYARNGQPEEAISFINLMHSNETIAIDKVASVVILSTCGNLGFRQMGEQIHCHVIKSGFFAAIELGNALVSMYAKCGSMNSAIKVFKFMPSCDIISWNSLMAGHLLHRQGDKVLAIWSKMEVSMVEPDNFTFVLVISAFRNTESNAVGKCYKLFESMKTIYDINPTSEHYASLISVLGFWGRLEEAEELILNMPLEPEASVWRALLHGCKLHSNTTLGKWAAKSILAMEPGDPATLILASNLYSASGRWHCSDKLREDMREKGFKKFPGRSWIIHENIVHSFYSRDKFHSQCKDIYSGVEILVMECLKAGYVPDTSFVLHEVEEHQKKDFLFYHSAKLAVTYGLLMTRRGQPVRVVKNIHLCGDCHTFFKYVSVVTKREISLRDASGFHIFTNGQCSCKA